MYAVHSEGRERYEEVLKQLLLNKLPADDFVVGGVDVRVAKCFVLFHLFQRVELISAAVADVAPGTGPFTTKDYLFSIAGIG